MQRSFCRTLPGAGTSSGSRASRAGEGLGEATAGAELGTCGAFSSRPVAGSFAGHTPKPHLWAVSHAAPRPTTLTRSTFNSRASQGGQRLLFVDTNPPLSPVRNLAHDFPPSQPSGGWTLCLGIPASMSISTLHIYIYGIQKSKPPAPLPPPPPPACCKRCLS